MANYARIVNNIAAEIITAPQTVPTTEAPGTVTFQLGDMYPPSFVALLTPVADTVDQYDIYDPIAKTWSKPGEPSE